MIIGLTGQARSGKDTFGEMLAEELFKDTGQNFVLMAYAHELKIRVQRDFDMLYEQLWGNSKETVDYRYAKSYISSKDEEPFWTPREIMQAYGQFYRTIDSLFWVKNLFNIIEDKEYKNVIITDIRHPNEADPVVNMGGVVIKITSNRSSKEDIHGKSHISETAMKGYNADFTVANDKGLPELRASAKDIVKLLRSVKKL